MPTQPEPTDRAEVQKLAAAVEEALAGAMPTSYRDDTPVPAGGTTAPVAQPETRIVPVWAVGTAVASIGLGAGSIGIGCAVWLAAQGLAAITFTGVLAAFAPFAGVALVVLAVGAALNRAKQAEPPVIHQHYEGPVYQDQRNVNTNTRGVWAKTRNQVR